MDVLYNTSMTRSLKILIVSVLVMVPAASAQAQAVHISSKQVCKLQPGQKLFARQILQKYDFTPSVIYAWLINEESGAYAAKRQRANNHNWLNLGIMSKAWKSPTAAADRTLSFTRGDKTVSGILRSAGKGAEAEIRAIAHSNWASSHYNNGNDLRYARSHCIFR